MPPPFPLSLTLRICENSKKCLPQTLHCHFIYIFFSCYCPTHHPQENWQVPIIVEVAQLVKDMPAMQETQVQSLGWEDPLEKGMETYSSILAWRMP